MGMFDDFVTNDCVDCPECNYSVGKNWQSKVGECTLSRYHEDQPYKELEHFRFFDIYTICPNQHFVMRRCTVDESGVFTATDTIWVEDPYEDKGEK